MKTKNAVLLIILEIIFVLTGMWGGSYLTHIFPYPNDFNTTSFFTGVFAFLSGIFCIVCGIERIIDNPKY